MRGGDGWVADPLLLAELAGDGAGARSGPAGRDVEPAAEPVLFPSVLDEIVGFAGPLSGAARRSQEGIEVELAGPPGSGKTVLAAQACQKLGRRLVSVDAAVLAGQPDPAAAAVREARQARLHDSVLTWQHADQLPDAAAAALDGLADLVFLETGGGPATATRPGTRAAALRARSARPRRQAPALVGAVRRARPGAGHRMGAAPRRDRGGGAGTARRRARRPGRAAAVDPGARPPTC